MTDHPDQIRQEIERTRGELGSDVDALTDKVNPRRIASERVNRVQSALHRLKDKAMGTATDAGHATTAAAQSVAAEAQQGASSAADKASSAASSVAHTADSAANMSRERIQGSPLAVGLIAFGVGVLASSLLPTSQTEEHLAGKAKDTGMRHSGQIKQQATDAVHQTQDNLRQPAQQAAQAVKSTATQGVSTVREQSRSVAKDVQGQARAATKDVQER
jgi:ElaB/YqjD/DUF883 family membrane-anchored ribosome-binding protein